MPQNVAVTNDSNTHWCFARVSVALQTPAVIQQLLQVGEHLVFRVHASLIYQFLRHT